jgi:hypothetical protein
MEEFFFPLRGLGDEVLHGLFGEFLLDGLFDFSFILYLQSEVLFEDVEGEVGHE